MSLDLKKAVKPYLRSRSKNFGHDRSQTIGSSLIGRCARLAWALTRLKEGDFPPGSRDPNGYAARGDDIEAHYAVPLIEHAIANQLPGAKLVWAGPGEQRTIEVLPWRLSSTPDGIVTNAPSDALKNYGISDLLSDCFPVEVKSFDPRIDKDSLPKQPHVDQLNAQMGLLDHHGEYKPKFGIILYVNASDYEDVIVVPIMFDRIAFERQIRRALDIYKQENMVSLRPEGAIAGGGECRTCPLKDKCSGYSAHVPSTVYAFQRLQPGVQSELMSAIGTYDNTRRQIRVYEARLDATKARIKELLSVGKTRKAEGKLKDGRVFRVNWWRVPGREVWDNDAVKAFIQSHNEFLYKFRKRTKGGEQLTIKLVEKDEFDPEERLENVREEDQVKVEPEMETL